MSYKVLTWNINQATNKHNRNIIPDWVGVEIKERTPDIVVLTEFCFCNHAKRFLEETFVRNGYDYFTKEDAQECIYEQNLILIAWKREKLEPAGKIEDVAWHAATTWTNNVPNFAKIGLRDKRKGIEFTVAGVRITMASKITAKKEEVELQQQQFQQQADLRREQMMYVLKALENSPRVIIAGDFNNYRRGTICERWNIDTLNCGMPYEVCTPEGQSIYQETAESREYEFAEDHFMVKGCSMKNYEYDRTFMEQYPAIYPYGKNFCVYDKLLDKEIWKLPYGSGYPDHAILLGELELEEGGTYVCTKCGREFPTKGYSIPTYCDECGDFD